MYCSGSDTSNFIIDNIEKRKKAIINVNYLNNNGNGNSILVKGTKLNGDVVVLSTITGKTTNLELDISNYVKLGFHYKEVLYSNSYVIVTVS